MVYHLNLVREAGLTEPYDNQGMTEFVFSGMTWQGHDLLDSIRDPVVWSKTKDAAKKVGGFSVQILTQIATAIIKDGLQKIGLTI